MMSTIKSRLRSLSRSFLIDMKDKLKSIYLRNLNIPFDYFEAVKDKIVSLNSERYNVRVITLNDNDFVYKKNIKFFHKQLPIHLPVFHHSVEETGREMIGNGGAQVMQDYLRIANYIPKISKNDDIHSALSSETLFIDVTWEINSILFINADKHETALNSRSTKIDRCYPLNKCFRPGKQGLYFNDMTITKKFMKMVNATIKSDRDSFIHSSSSFISIYKELSYSLGKTITHYLSATPHDKESVASSESSRTQDKDNTEKPRIKEEPAISMKYMDHIPKSQHKTIFILYLKYLQLHITQYLVSHMMLEEDITPMYYISIEQSILNYFTMDYEVLKLQLLDLKNNNQFFNPMKLIQREHLSAVYCKDMLKCYETVEEYLDYPQYIIQAQLHHTYINLILNKYHPVRHC
ncbi:hypothetical protein BDB01DRAFT_478822 [Pilobolus umbonatus]|nr:hypothetical protein BDB01DRAFT_478822 [Pilobolus umbonatus]